MNYYIQQDEKIVLFDENLERLQNTIAIMPQYQGLEIQETEREIIELNNEFVFEDEVKGELVQERENLFKKDFFNIEGYGWYRKTPKGYTSAVESINTAFNIVTVVGILPKGSLIFYTKPDFTDETQCTEEWLIENQIKSDEMTATKFGKFYAAFVTAWNKQEHLEE